jgi:hypothetical protein
MSANSLTVVTIDLIETYGNTVRNVLGIYGASNERAIDYLNQGLNGVLKLDKPIIVGDLYSKGVAFTAEGAEKVFAQVVAVATKSVERLSANANSFVEKAIFGTTNQISQIALPIARKVSVLATQLEQRSGAALNRVSGEKPITVKPKRTRTPVKKAASVRRKTKSASS